MKLMAAHADKDIDKMKINVLNAQEDVTNAIANRASFAIKKHTITQPRMRKDNAIAQLDILIINRNRLVISALLDV